MAVYYVWSGAPGSANGTTWANAYLTITAAFAGKLPGDTFYVAHDHVENSAVNLNNLNSFGTLWAVSKVLCVNRLGLVPPSAADRRIGAQINTTGASSITLTASAGGGGTIWDGIIFNVGSGTGSAFFNAQASGTFTRLDNCSIRLGTTGGSVGKARFGASSSYVELNNTSFVFNATAQGIEVAGFMRWQNTGAVLVGGIVPLSLFTPSNNSTMECIGVDFSTFAGGGKYLVNVNNTTTQFKFIDCKIDPATITSAYPSQSGSFEIDYINCSSSTGGAHRRHRMTGLLNESRTRYRHGGARDHKDGTGPHAWEISIGTTYCNYLMPFETLPMAIWNDVISQPVTAIVEGLWNGDVLPKNDEVWLEATYLSDPASPKSTLISDGKPNVLAYATAQSPSNALWAGSPTSGVPASRTLSGTPQACVLSNGNLTATRNAVYTESGGVISLPFEATGKRYFEATVGKWTFVSSSVGIISSTGKLPLADANGAANKQINVLLGTGSSVVYANGGLNQGDTGPAAEGDVWCMAYDLDARLFWARRWGYPGGLTTEHGLWNGNEAADPALGIGGISIGTGSWAPYVGFQGNGGIGDSWTANFGQFPFASPPPLGFDVGDAKWTPFKLECSFTPQRRGYVYGRIKVGRPVSSVYIDPQVRLKNGALPPPLTVSGTPVTSGIEYEHGPGSTYGGFTVTASGGDAPYNYSLVSGRLPPGITLDPSTGIVSGTPAFQSSGTYPNICIRATDGSGKSGELPPFTIAISYKDPHWGSVVFQIDQDMPDGGVIFTDQKSGANMTIAQGSPNHTKQNVVPYGSSSMFSVANEYMQMPDDPKWHLASSPFTIDFVARIDSLQTTGYWLGQFPTAASNRAWALGGFAAELRFVVSTDGVNSITVLSALGALDITSGYHWWRVDFDGATYRMYKDGAVIARSTTPYAITDSTLPFTLGSAGSAGSTGIWGYYRGVRITKGVARTGSDSGYTVSTSRAHPTS